MKARIKFRKTGVMKFIGHLDVMRYFQKAMRRADIPIAFTSGYSPHMIMSFAQPLGIGITSDAEYLDIELAEPVTSADAVGRLNSVMVEGIEVVSLVKIADDRKSSGMTIVAAAGYEVTFPETFQTSEEVIRIPESWKEQAESFMNQEQIVVWKKTKRSEKEVDIKPMIYDFTVNEDSIYLLLATGSEQNLKPDLVMETYVRYMGMDIKKIPVHYHRLEVYARKDGNLVPLEKLEI
ncbi:putative radical SAM domain protein [Dorea sp. D27]|nr:TIGR03936 family radical SAM-associated protein [Dorea sp. D27]KMZ54944.1 putative radical SAM domain protein [Dorea sp. D27]